MAGIFYGVYYLFILYKEFCNLFQRNKGSTARALCEAYSVASGLTCKYPLWCPHAGLTRRTLQVADSLNVT